MRRIHRAARTERRARPSPPTTRRRKSTPPEARSASECSPAVQHALAPAALVRCVCNVSCVCVGRVNCGMWHSEQPLSLGSFTCQEVPAINEQSVRERAASDEWRVTAAGEGMGSSMEQQQRSSRSRSGHHVNIQVPLVQASDDEDDASVPRRITRSTSVNDTSRTRYDRKPFY